MVPDISTCELCGRTVLVLGWSAVYDDAAALLSADGAHDLDITCRVECPRCGPRIQRVNPVDTSSAPNAA